MSFPRTLFYALIFLFVNLQVKAQNAEKLLEDVICQYDKETYELTLNYKLYKGEEGTKVYESYSGIVSKNKDKIYQRIGPMESLQNKFFYVKLNHEDKEMLVMERTEKNPLKEFSSMDLGMIKKYFDLEGMKKYSNYYELILSAKPDNPLGVYKIILQLNKKTNLIKKQILFLSTAVDFSIYEPDSSEPEYDVARLEISYMGFKEKINKKYFNERRYFSQNGKTFIPGKKFKDFELVPVNQS